MDRRQLPHNTEHNAPSMSAKETKPYAPRMASSLACSTHKRLSSRLLLPRSNAFKALRGPRPKASTFLARLTSKSSSNWSGCGAGGLPAHAHMTVNGQTFNEAKHTLHFQRLPFCFQPSRETLACKPHTPARNVNQCPGSEQFELHLALHTLQ